MSIMINRLLVCVTCLFLNLPLWAADPLVMAHRGASGYLPEHTLAAKAMAHAQGAHYLEQDVVLTRDGVPLVLHDIHLDTLTDVADQFPDRRRADGRFYAIDFTLQEIKQLKATERFNARTGDQVYSQRFPKNAYTYQLHTLEEEIQFIQGLKQSTGRTAWLFPEIKQTTFHQNEGQDIVRIVFDLLQRYGYGVIVTENLPANSPSLDAWHDALFNGAGVDGVVTDFPDLTAQWLTENGLSGRTVSYSAGSQQSVGSQQTAGSQQTGTPNTLDDWPRTHDGGRWNSGHVQGIAIDVEKRQIYYSFTNLLARYDFEGRLLGTLVGWTGHLGDLTFNPADGKVYGSLEYKADEAFYIAVVDGARINRVGIEAADSDIMKTVYLPEVSYDYAADMDGDGVFDGDIADTADHRYGSSGIDGVAFGPAFGRTDGPQYLTVGYGVYSNLERTDNDHQVLLQYDVSNWERYARPLVESAPHRSGPSDLAGKYFVYTGNTRYGVQNIAYDADMERWFMGVYQGEKPQFPNYQLFAVEAATRPVMSDLVGVPSPAGGWQQGRLLALADDGLKDPATGIRGWNHKADMGIQALGNGLFYLSVNSRGVSSHSRGASWQGATLHLMRWTDNPQQPFVPVP